jgi:hypothetical protein
MRGKRYVSLDLPEGEHHYILVDWTSKPKKSLSEAETKRISRKEASNALFIIRE